LWHGEVLLMKVEGDVPQSHAVCTLSDMLLLSF